MESWQELSNPRDLTKIFQTAEYAAWKSLRESEDARYIGLAMPRFLSRLPYGAKTVPVEEFGFEEDTEGADHRKYVWSNAAYAMGVNITRAFKLYGWCARIRGAESGGMVEGLPVHTFPTDDGGVDMKCPTEIAITDRREAELAKNGFMPLSHYKNTDYAVFMGAQSLQKPAVYDDPDATANANLAARLPYLFATCRFAHYLKCMVRDKIGSFKERADMEMWLNKWISQYCCDSKSSEEMKARYPLAEAGRPPLHRYERELRAAGERGEDVHRPFLEPGLGDGARLVFVDGPHDGAEEERLPGDDVLDVEEERVEPERGAGELLEVGPDLVPIHRERDERAVHVEDTELRLLLHVPRAPSAWSRPPSTSMRPRPCP